MEFTIHINRDNAAFGETEAERDTETARILHGLANRLEGGVWEPGAKQGHLLDVNGNKVGVWYKSENE